MSPNPKPANLAAAAALLALSACGFTPLYGQSGDASVAQKLDTVSVANIPERTGQMLRLALQTDLYTAGPPTTEAYSLTVTYSVGQSAIGIEQDSASTRTRFNANAIFTLTPIGDPSHPILGGQVTTEDALNVVDQQYFASTLETDTVNQQVSNQLAAAITSRLAAYFKTHPNA